MTTSSPDTTDTQPGPEQALRAAKPPVGNGLSPVFGQLIAAMLIALGVLGVQEAVHRVGLADTSWMGWLLHQATGRTATFATLVVCVLAVAAGVILLAVAIRPRPRRALALTATTGVYLRTADLARLARNRVDGAEGVTDVNADATRSKLTVRVITVTPTAENPTVQSEIEQRLQPLISALDHSPRLNVQITNQDLT